MADFTNDRDAPRIFPVQGVAADHDRLEPLITPAQLKDRELWGIDLVSNTKNRQTGRTDVMTDALLADLIEGAAMRTEAYLDITIFPVQVEEKHAFDRAAYQQFGYMQLEKKPIASVQAIDITPSGSNEIIYTVPIEWVETGHLPYGQLYLTPLAQGVGGSATAYSYSGNAYFITVGATGYWNLPGFWRVRYTTGFKDGMVPRHLNDLIGTEAAIAILSMLGATNARAQSQSLGIDGLSQSTSGPGPNIYDTRIKDLEQKKALLTKKCKAMFGRKIWASTL